jgi:hypothetical protein
MAWAGRFGFAGPTGTSLARPYGTDRGMQPLRLKILPWRGWASAVGG